MSISSEERKEYQRQYYLRNREKISQRKKDRYQNDPEAREHAKEAAKMYRTKKKAEEDKLRAEGKFPIVKPKKPKKQEKPVRINIGGKICIGYPIEFLANEIGCSVYTIKNWIKAGTIPDTPLKINGRKRLYTDGMILSIKIALQSKGIIWFVDKEMYNKIVEDWKKLGLNVC